MLTFMKVNGALLALLSLGTSLMANGKEKVVKEIVEEIDEEKKLIKKKIIEGDLLEDYKSFCITAHVDTKDENNLVTWILEYEKKNANVSDPHTFMKLCLNMTKDIETYHIK
ncbi:hypothetical protein KY290_001392 [Solanum tuberosum]|uniref:Bet v I/Major latex protein domain-containing protein n=1 Tax=Solanum tuberosum TaxID=4113 RepID=A0ABQ7WM33_SOLTU|nr:hypothetical protein KY290_001392 [Solanum tuberosum]